MGMNKRTALLAAGILTFGVGTLYLGITMKNSLPPKDPNSWDILIFTQTWPNTLCYLWKGQNTNHTCDFPPLKNLWTIHGIWPTKYGTIGPQFCNKSSEFNPRAIFGIKDKLNQYWTDIEIPSSNNTETNSSSTNIFHKKESLYKHEWEKHGTCAVSLPTLNSEFKYFSQGIEWSEKYNMKDILEKGGIKLNGTSNVFDIWKAVKLNLKTNVWVQCEFKHDTKEQMLDEIRICFDKSLKLIDCDGIMMKASRRGSTKTAHLLTNCDLKKPVLYLDYVPERNTSTDSNTINFNSTYSNSTNNDTDWDRIVFSQTWPYTFCHTWTVNSNIHECKLPPDHSQWTIHGIWPSKTGSLGPFYCKKNEAPFHIDELNPIIPELENRWTEIKGKNKQEGGLWKYEWNKHGTCSLSLPTLDSELKYFKQGLEWSKQYNVTELLAQGGINPNGTYPIKQFWLTLKTGLRKNPQIECFIEKSSNKVYIDEVRLCFDKSLSLIDCDSFKTDKSKPYTNCPEQEEIYYVGVPF